MDFNIYKYKYL